MQSESIGELAKALCKVQGELKEPIKSAVNPFFKSKYADLASIWTCARESLSKHGLSIVQVVQPDETDHDVLITKLIHESGEWIKSVATINPVKNDPQSYGSAMTYLRRYTLAAMLGVSGEDDDDGNAATKSDSNKQIADNIFKNKPPKKHVGGGVKGMNQAIKTPEEIMGSLLAILKEHGGKTQDDRLTFLRSLIVAHTIGVDAAKITNPAQLKGLDVSNVIAGFTATMANELFKK